MLLENANLADPLIIDRETSVSCKEVRRRESPDDTLPSPLTAALLPSPSIGASAVTKYPPGRGSIKSY